ncbi:MAG: hypothetical protein KHW95_09295 [Firmicutes bacterium]|nr:hypothetical protein [Bacillota bacterium]
MKSVRILCTASIGYCTAVFLSHYLLFGESIIAVLSLPVMLALSAFLFRGRMRTRIIIARYPRPMRAFEREDNR